MEEAMPWKLRTHNTFANKSRLLEEGYDSQYEVHEAAQRELEQIEEQQPTESSGGQADDGIQDRIFIICPDGTEYRFSLGGYLDGMDCCVILKETAHSIVVKTKDGRTVSIETDLPNVQEGHRGILFNDRGKVVFIREPYAD